MSKLKNNKAVAEMLEGRHRTQTRKTFGFGDAKDTAVARKVGDIWEEKDFHGNTVWYEQKDGYRVSTNVHPTIVSELQKIRDSLSTFPNCRKEVCTCTYPSNLDEKFRRIVGMCEDCLISYETHLKMTGQFNQYAMQKMRANAESFFKQADGEVEILKEGLKDVNFLEGESGRVEQWSSDNVSGLIERINQNYSEFKEKTMQRFKEK